MVTSCSGHHTSLSFPVPRIWVLDCVVVHYGKESILLCCEGDYDHLMVRLFPQGRLGWLTLSFSVLQPPMVWVVPSQDGGSWPCVHLVIGERMGQGHIHQRQGQQQLFPAFFQRGGTSKIGLLKFWCLPSTRLYWIHPVPYMAQNSHFTYSQKALSLRSLFGGGGYNSDTPSHSM